MPESLLRAAVCLAISWRWYRFASCLLIAFNGLGHPSSVIAATREDLVLPADLLSNLSLAFLRIRDPKTRRYMTRQHLRISDSHSVEFLQALFKDRPMSEKIFGLGSSAFRLRWDRLFSALGIPVRESERGLTPGSLRGSGATFLYFSTENLPLIAWRGRWRRQRTMEAYLQEVSASQLLTRITVEKRARIAELAALCGPLMMSFVTVFESPATA